MRCSTHTPKARVPEPVNAYKSRVRACRMLPVLQESGTVYAVRVTVICSALCELFLK